MGSAPGRMDYYSEPEMSPMVMSPIGSRPATPILSDTEYETNRSAPGTAEASDGQQSWEWGQLPTTSTSSQGDDAKCEGKKNEGEQVSQKVQSIFVTLMVMNDDE